MIDGAPWQRWWLLLLYTLTARTPRRSRESADAPGPVPRSPLPRTSAVAFHREEALASHDAAANSPGGRGRTWASARLGPAIRSAPAAELRCGAGGSTGPSLSRRHHQLPLGPGPNPGVGPAICSALPLNSGAGLGALPLNSGHMVWIRRQGRRRGRGGGGAGQRRGVAAVAGRARKDAG